MSASSVIDLLLQVSAAIAGPAALGAAKYARDVWKSNNQTTKRNAEANFGAEEPHNPWPGTVSLTVDHEQRLEQIENELDLEPPEDVSRYNHGMRRAPDGGVVGYRARLREWLRRRLRGL